MTWREYGMMFIIFSSLGNCAGDIATKAHCEQFGTAVLIGGTHIKCEVIKAAPTD
jgi:hypothetical protein